MQKSYSICFCLKNLSLSGIGQALKYKKKIKSLLSKLLKIVSVATVSDDMIRYALELPWKDFEDSARYSVALLQEMEMIITRNSNDYKDAEINIRTPEELLSHHKDLEI